MVQLHLDYRCQIWDPHLVKDKKETGGRANFACRLASQQCDCSYRDLLQLYELPSLEERTLHLKLGLMFKIITQPLLQSRHTIFFVLIFTVELLIYSNLNCLLPILLHDHTMSVWNSLDSKCVTSSILQFIHKSS